MANLSFARIVSFPAALSIGLAACSSEMRDLRPSARAVPDGGGGGGGAGTFEPSGTTEADASITVNAVTPGSECATASAGATRPPAHLVFIYDRSISMGFAVGSTTVWDACKAGLTAFFAAPTSAGLRASLAFFGKDDTLDSAKTCGAGSYATPDVSIRALPNATDFAAAIAATQPFTGTPTLPALKGAIQYAKSVKATVNPGEKVAVVLVTDGGPTGCTNNTVATVRDKAASAFALGIPTYVIGIGQIANLQVMAGGGGTSAIAIDTTSPAQVTSDIETALGHIGAAELGCEYVLPEPPAGQALDVNAVNVNYTSVGGALQTLPYSGDCADPRGWHYDDVKAPSTIVACADLCAALEQDRGGKVEIIFGCTTAVPPGGAPPIPR